MPTLFFADSAGQHENRVTLKKLNTINAARSRNEQEFLKEDERRQKAEWYARREERANQSRDEQLKAQRMKYVKNDKGWRKRRCEATNIKAEYEVRFVSKSVDGLLNREQRLVRRADKRADLLDVYGNRATLSQTNNNAF